MRRLVVLFALASCGKHTPSDQPPPPLDRASIYPLIVRANELPTGPVRRPLVDGLVVTLAAAQPGGQAKLLRDADLRGVTLDEAYTAALANLEAAAKRGEIQVHAEVGSDGRQLDIAWGHDWRAAACVLLPGVRQQAERALMAEHIRAVIPNRDVLVLFADRSVATAALAAEQGAPRPISDRVLRIEPTAADEPFWIRSPVVWDN